MPKQSSVNSARSHFHHHTNFSLISLLLNIIFCSLPQIKKSLGFWRPAQVVDLRTSAAFIH